MVKLWNFRNVQLPLSTYEKFRDFRDSGGFKSFSLALLELLEVYNGKKSCSGDD